MTVLGPNICQFEKQINCRNSQNYAIEVSYMNSLMQVWILLIKPALTKLSSLIKQENKKTSIKRHQHRCQMEM